MTRVITRKMHYNIADVTRQRRELLGRMVSRERRSRVGRIATEADVRAVIVEGEHERLEFKSEKTTALSDRDVFEEVVALANSGGGILLLGVDDGGTITGAVPRHGATTDVCRLAAAIRNNTHPGVVAACVEVRTTDGPVLAVQVAGSAALQATRSGKCLRRQVGADGKPETVPFYPSDHGIFHTTAATADYSAQLLEGASLDDLDPLQFRRVRQTIERLHGDSSLVDLTDEEIAKALRLVTTRGGVSIPTVAGMLIAGTAEAIEEYLPTHAVHFQVLDSTGAVRLNDSFRGPVLEIVEEVSERFLARNEEDEIQIGLVRLPVPDYAPESFREAFNNALLHRDYSRLGGIFVQMHPDHILITSPGPFPAGVTVGNLLVHEPLPRNPRLAEAFKRIGLVEQTGRGIDRIYLGQLRYGRPAPDYSRTDSEGVRVVLPGGRPSLEFAALVYEEGNAGRALTLDELMVLNALFTERRVYADSVGELIQKGVPAARSVLERLAERGLVEGRGQRRGRSFMLSAALYRRLHQEAEYVRARGFEPVQQEQMVMDYVGAHGRIGRAEASELCRITPRQATALLARLVARGDLEMHGTKRGAHYVARRRGAEQR